MRDLPPRNVWLDGSPVSMSPLQMAVHTPLTSEWPSEHSTQLPELSQAVHKASLEAAAPQQRPPLQAFKLLQASFTTPSEVEVVEQVAPVAIKRTHDN
jgi:hypothetical protein